MDWKPVASPYAQAKRATLGLAVKVRAAFILLISAWHMKPSHFKPESNSFYKGLGWWLPLVPGSVYAWVAHYLFVPPILKEMTDFPAYLFLFSNVALMTILAHANAATSYVFHFSMCRAGRVFKMREAPPPYEFFLVRACGAMMWFAAALCILILPLLAREQSALGWLASLVLAVLLVWIGLFLVAGHSWQIAGSTSKIGLKNMYQSDRFIKFVWRTECVVLCVSGILLFSMFIVLSRYPELIQSLS